MNTKTVWLSLSVLFLLFGPQQSRAKANEVCGCRFDKDAVPKNVSVMFKGSKKGLEPARKGMQIYKHTVLRVTAPASAILYCDDGLGGVKKEKLDGRNTAPPVPCSESANNPLIGSGRKIDLPRPMGVPNEGCPRVLSPRHTLLLDTPSELSWSTISGTLSYQVSIKSETGDVVWSAEIPAKTSTREQTIKFPIKLQENVNYKVVVEGNGRSSEEDEDPDLSFSLASDSTRIRQEVEKIKQLKAGKRTTDFLLAALFASRGLNYDALRVLKSFPQREEDAEIVRLRGELYLALGLRRQAEAEFLRVVSYPLKERDSTDGQAFANTALGKIYESFGNEVKSRQYFNAVDRLLDSPSIMPQGTQRPNTIRITPVKP